MHITKMLPLPTLALLAACSVPPKPPTVDPSFRHPANAAGAVDLQICRSALQNTRIQTIESDRAAAATSATLAHLIAQQRALRDLWATRPPEEQRPLGNMVYAVRFDYGSARFNLPEQAARSLIDQAKSAPLILLRGRTDGTAESAAESRVARERASAVRDFLIASGIDPVRIRATYQPAGDPVADNGTPAGRSLNRRVEIEFYRELPAALDANTGKP